MKMMLLALSLVVVSATGARAAIDHSADGKWADLLHEADKAGYKFDHTCYTQNKPAYCTLTMTSPPMDGGKILTLIETYDTNDQLMGRAICAADTSKVASPQRRHCFYIDDGVEVEEMYDDVSKGWQALSSERIGDTLAVLTHPLAPPRGPSYTAVKEWDNKTMTGTFIHRSLYAGSDRSMRLFASERDASGNRIASSTCNFTQTSSDCINQDGQHYQLEPNSIAYFYSLLRRTHDRRHGHS
jgi:hypothetical protein